MSDPYYSQQYPNGSFPPPFQSPQTYYSQPGTSYYQPTTPPNDQYGTSGYYTNDRGQGDVATAVVHNAVRPTGPVPQQPASYPHQAGTYPQPVEEASCLSGCVIF
ncbi:uncharacterized protein PHACADRAFT_265469 [Phanerochaete carnosa HHB-10118-sp]|uniref:Uncharacterized protein n=1 Tax=Phanerochaete carnosa (strain HHB-10118-sp) TaxID=650164 RepID=K5VTA7_PHACS|nr:uncharacterized protein PHACADRAFT_265469 [Phanerochaete carnosa HHB-10118-sp]EKM49784.1 hypothetical protein PHACADRAFT_265469 [Phanerochaete carnosa HHB-10118-sp]